MLCHVYCTFCAGTLGLLLPLMVQTQNAEFDWTKTRLKSGQCQLTQISVHCRFSLKKGPLNVCVCVCRFSIDWLFGNNLSVGISTQHLLSSGTVILMSGCNPFLLKTSHIGLEP